MGSARDELAAAAFWARLADDEHDRPDPEPARVKTPCTRCNVTLCWGDVCRDCLPSDNQPRRVR